MSVVKPPYFLRFSFLVLCSTSLFACRLSVEQATARLDEALKKQTTQEDVHSAVMWIDAPRQGISRGFAHGVSDVGRNTRMQVETPFYSASVGKLLVAATVMKQIEFGKMSLEDSPLRFVPLEALRGLPLRGEASAWNSVTLRQLLTHRSGLPDYFSGNSKDGAPRVFDLLVTEPSRSWTRAELFEYTRAHFEAVGAPGETFHYSDTGYDVLGLVLEKASGKPFHELVRETVLTPLDMRHTYYHAFEKAPEGLGAPAQVWVKGKDVRGAPSLSADQAGGGLVTTAEDLRKLIRGLMAGNPFKLSDLATDFTENAMHSGIDVGRAAWRIRPRGVFFALAGLPEMVGHSGATGVWAYAVPEWDAVLVGAFSDARWQERHIEFLLRDIVPTLARVSVNR